jgi:NADH-ubiquinone oxidoreductase chain 2
LSFSLIISLLSLAGIPPLLGFYAKQFTLYAALESGHYFLAVLAIVTSVISASYYLKIIRLNFSTDTYYKESAILMEGYNQEVIQDKYETTAGQIPNGQAPKTGAEFLEGAGGDKESTSSVIDMLPYPVSYFISFFTLFILIYAIKPSIISSSTGVLSLYLLGFLH